MDQVLKKKAEARGRQLAGFWGEETRENLSLYFWVSTSFIPSFYLIMRGR